MVRTDGRPIGFGRLTRKEDARFIRGQGTFVDDVQLEGMLHGAILRSPVAHARVRSIDTSAALQHPKVHAVITGADLQARDLAWMPTLSSDTQAVLATDKVRFQGQEIAFVIADDRYSARDAPRIVASAMLEVAPDDLAWEKGRWFVRGDPEQGARIPEIAMAARGSLELPPGVETGLDAETVYDPPNLTFPFGAYVCVVDIDPETAKVKVRRFVAVDDCGTRINPMIVEGQIHRGLTDGVGIALMEQLSFDEEGNCLGASLMDYLIPTAVEVPDWETDFTVTPSPHHPLGAKGVGESATVGSPPAIVNAVVDALRPYGVRHVDMPCTPSRVWEAMNAAAGVLQR
jgi:CO/xanthine dehydrogenase Mo-binding subunit